MSSFACATLAASCCVDDSYAGDIVQPIFINMKWYCTDFVKTSMNSKSCLNITTIHDVTLLDGPNLHCGNLLMPPCVLEMHDIFLHDITTFKHPIVSPLL